MNSTLGGTLRSLNNVTDDTSGYSQTQGTSVTCSAAYCHSQGEGTFVASPEWYAGSVSGSCDDCHGNSPGTNAHSAHVVGIHYDSIYSGSTGLASAGTGNTDSHGSATYSTTINCNTCHNNTVTASANDQNTLCSTCHDGGTATLQGDMSIAAGSTAHLSGTVDVALNAVNVKSKAQLRDDITTVTELNESWDRTASGVGYKAAGAYDQANNALNTATMYDSASNTCATVACHNGNTAQPVRTVTATCRSKEYAGRMRMKELTLINANAVVLATYVAGTAAAPPFDASVLICLASRAA
jgi:predicted CxxxxCH...CXXCH cytochrome family protein